MKNNKLEQKRVHDFNDQDDGRWIVGEDGQQSGSGRKDGRGICGQREWGTNLSEDVEPRIHRKNTRRGEKCEVNGEVVWRRRPSAVKRIQRLRLMT
jgi:hypothetical protein